VIAALLVVAVAGPIAAGLHQRDELRHFRVVREGVLYRSAQLTVPGIRRAIKDHGIRTIVNLRDGNTRVDRDEESFCQQAGIRFVRIAPLSWDGVQGSAPVDAGLKTFLDVVADPANHPILIHCFRGIHRTGSYVAIYRMEYENWPLNRALNEMQALGYVQLDEHHDVRGYFQHYKRTGTYQLPLRSR
jgi:protein tyrosine/serine phosphatase